MFKVLITGPESSGKSFLANAMTTYFKGVLVSEFSRQYLALRPSYEESDLLEIAKGQQSDEESKASENPSYLFCDTAQEVLMIWSQEKFQRVHPLIKEMWLNSSYDLILLCKPNIAWVPDALRENPNDRNRLFDLYQDLLETRKKTVRIIDAKEEARVQQAIQFIQNVK